MPISSFDSHWPVGLGESWNKGGSMIFNVALYLPWCNYLHVLDGVQLLRPFKGMELMLPGAPGCPEVVCFFLFFHKKVVC